MQAEVIAVGTELVLGDSVDTNSAWISGRLAEIGVDVTRHVAVGDDLDRMVGVLQEACRRADAVLLTGGLGPTQDDLTKVAMAQVAGVALQRDDAMADDIAAYFSSRGREMPSNNLQQADKPAGAWWLTRVGTAPGIGLQVGGAVVYCMPGVPQEMQVMMDTDVVPDLQRRGGLAAAVSRTVRTSGLSESGIAATLADLVEELEAAGNPSIAFLASRGETRVKVMARGATRDAALSLAAPVVSRVVTLLGAGVVGLDEEGTEFAIGRRLVSAGLTVAVAESVTGGGLGARLVSVPGASEWFRGGLITYATQTKVSLAGLDSGALALDGAVSGSTAEALALAAVDRLGADVGVSVVGVAGPAEQDGQPVGTIWIGTVGPDGFPRARQVLVPGRSRVQIQEYAASAALSALYRYVVRLTEGG